MTLLIPWEHHAPINPKRHSPKDVRSCNICLPRPSHRASTFRRKSWAFRLRLLARTSHARGASPPRWPRRCISLGSPHSSIPLARLSNSCRSWWMHSRRRRRQLWPCRKWLPLSLCSLSVKYTVEDSRNVSLPYRLQWVRWDWVTLKNWSKWLSEGGSSSHPSSFMLCLAGCAVLQDFTFFLVCMRGLVGLDILGVVCVCSLMLPPFKENQGCIIIVLFPQVCMNDNS